MALAAVALYVAAFWPSVVGEVSNACEGRSVDHTAWPPGGSCGDVAWRQFYWPWAEWVVLGLAGTALVLAGRFFTRPD